MTQVFVTPRAQRDVGEAISALNLPDDAPRQAAELLINHCGSPIFVSEVPGEGDVAELVSREISDSALPELPLSRYPASPIISCEWSLGSTLTGTCAPG